MESCSVELVAGTGADRSAEPDLLIEVPHGGTRRAHFDAVRSELHGSYPDDLIEFFFVNTDVGAPECASRIAHRFVERTTSAQVLVLRGLVPRTFVDCNRVVDGRPSAEVRDGMTPGLPSYVDHAADADTLMDLYRAYHVTAGDAYRRVCGNGGLALMLHTYAPKSVEIERVDDDIVGALRRAYEPEVFEGWTPRPDVDVISRTIDDRTLSPPGLPQAIRDAYAQIGIDATENGTYSLHPSTMGYVYSDAYPGRVICVELNRALLADPFEPFREMRIGRDNVVRMSEPLVAALSAQLR